MLAGDPRGPRATTTRTPSRRRSCERRNLVLERDAQAGHDQPRPRWTPPTKEPMTLAPPNNGLRGATGAILLRLHDRARDARSTATSRRSAAGCASTPPSTCSLQDMAERTVVSDDSSPTAGPDAALVCIDPRTGYIKAMVGGKNYAASQFNVAADGHRQAGSSFKTFVLCPGAWPTACPPTRPTTPLRPGRSTCPDGGKWKVNNYDGHGSGSMTIRDATIHSVNCVYAQLIMDVGPSSRVARRWPRAMGRQSPVEPNISGNPALLIPAIPQRKFTTGKVI